MGLPPQELKYRLTLILSEIKPSTDVYSDPTNSETRRIETANKVTESVIESNSIIELKAGVADFRTNLREN